MLDLIDKLQYKSIPIQARAVTIQRRKTIGHSELLKSAQHQLPFIHHTTKWNEQSTAFILIFPCDLWTTFCVWEFKDQTTEKSFSFSLRMMSKNFTQCCLDYVTSHYVGSYDSSIHVVCLFHKGFLPMYNGKKQVLGIIAKVITSNLQSGT